MRWGSRIVLPLLALLLGAVWWQFRENTSVPELGFTTIGGEQLALKDLRGQPFLVTFWASDCRTCLLEIPELDRLYRDYAGRGFRVFAVAMAYDVPSRVLSLVRESNLGYTVVLDSNGRLAAGFGDVRGVPLTFLVGADGRIRQRAAGAVDFARLRQQIGELLGES